MVQVLPTTFYYLMNFIVSLLLVVCAVVSAVRLSRSPAGIFGPIGFGLLFVESVVSHKIMLLSRMFGTNPMYLDYTLLPVLLGLGFLFIVLMLFTMRVNKKTDVVERPSPEHLHS
jgi:hypothetical protein